MWFHITPGLVCESLHPIPFCPSKKKWTPSEWTPAFPTPQPPRHPPPPPVTPSPQVSRLKAILWTNLNLTANEYSSAIKLSEGICGWANMISDRKIDF